MSELFNSLLQGVLIGGLYALFAAGLSVVFGVMRIVNLAHGDLIVIGSFLSVVIIGSLNIPLLPALLIVPLVMGCFGYLLQRFILNKVVGEDVLPPLLVTFGLSIIIQNSLLEIFAADSRKVNLGEIETASIQIFEGVAVGQYTVIVFAVAVATIGALHFLSMKTAFGRAYRAVADDLEVARLNGINAKHIFSLAMALAMVVCGIAGLVFSIWTSFTPLSGPSRLLLAFEVIVIGGIGSIWGTLVGGIVLGLAQAVGGYISPAWQTFAGHFAFLVVVMVWPNGILGRRK